MDVPTEQWDDGEATRSPHSECHIRSRFGYSQSGSPILVNTPSRIIPPVQRRLLWLQQLAGPTIRQTGPRWV
jgi:hypothetical protein